MDSYIVSSQIQTGNYCSIATNITMLLDLNHDYKSVTTSAASFLNECQSKIRRKGQIIIQNDVWIGHDTILMSGIKIGNGAVIGAGSVVAKDIPPYSIAVGNPCKVIKYRFTPEQIQKLQLIHWWDFKSETLLKHRNIFSKDIESFIAAFYPEALEKNEIII